MYTRIFFPYDCLCAESGILIGYNHLHDCCIYIVSVIPIKERKSVLDKINSLLPKENMAEVLGVWIKHSSTPKFSSCESVLISCKTWLVLRIHKQCLSAAFVQRKHVIDSEVQNAVFCLFNRAHLLNGRNLLPLIKDNVASDVSKNQGLLNKLLFCDNNLNFGGDSLADLADSQVLLCLYTHITNFDDVTKRTVSKKLTPNQQIHNRFLYQAWIKFILICAILEKFAWKCVNFFNITYLNNAIEYSSVGTHVLLKLKLLSKFKEQDCPKQLKYELLSAFIGDVVIGLVFCVWLYSCSQIWLYISTTFMPSVDVIAKQLEELIRWLMGIPIGLKLNSPLNQFLGKFFLHHVHLWLEYIQILLLTLTSDNAAKLMWLFYLSCFGFSFVIAIISDVLSLLTFHIYCFYIYATRLYGLQIAGLMSFWRLFRGKKWNPLRSRVDTLPHSPDLANHRFFTGTLIFTILLFLLPTTALYYAIFAIFRLVVLCFQKQLYSLGLWFTCFPWFSLVRRLFKPHSFATFARFNRTDILRTDKGEGCAFFKVKSRTHFKLPLKNIEVLYMVLDIRSAKSVVYSGFIKIVGTYSSLYSLDIRNLSSSLLSGKILKWI